MDEFTTPHALPGEPTAPCDHPGRDGYCDTAGCWSQRSTARPAPASPASLPGQDLDQAATAITFGVLLACVAELGPTRRAVAAAYAAVALTDAIADEEDDDGARPVRDS